MVKGPGEYHPEDTLQKYVSQKTRILVVFRPDRDGRISRPPDLWTTSGSGTSHPGMGPPEGGYPEGTLSWRTSWWSTGPAGMDLCVVHSYHCSVWWATCGSQCIPQHATNEHHIPEHVERCTTECVDVPHLVVPLSILGICGVDHLRMDARILSWWYHTPAERWMRAHVHVAHMHQQLVVLRRMWWYIPGVCGGPSHHLWSISTPTRSVSSGCCGMWSASHTPADPRTRGI